jgi:hypothetical protein
MWWWLLLFIIAGVLKSCVKLVDRHVARQDVIAAERARKAAQAEDVAASRPAPGRRAPQFPAATEQKCETCRNPAHIECSGDADCPCCQHTANLSEDAASAALREKVANALTQLGYTKAQCSDAVRLAWQHTDDEAHGNEQAMLKAALKQLAPRR